MILSFETTEATQRANSGDGKGLAPENIGRFPFPAVEGAGGAATDTLGGLNGWAVTKNAPPEALDFLRYLTNAENERLMASIGMIVRRRQGPRMASPTRWCGLRPTSSRPLPGTRTISTRISAPPSAAS